MIRDLVEFRSDRFAPVLPESCQTNPGRYGAELAFWLGLGLYRQSGVATSYPEDDDLDWILGYTTDSGDEFALHCGNVDGARDRWRIAVRSHARKWLGRDRPPFGRANVLIDAIRRLLDSEPSISESRWLMAGEWTQETASEGP